MLSTLLLLATYLLVTIATVSFAGVGTKGIGLGNPANVDDVFTVMSPEVFGGGPLGTVLKILFAATILTSASASTQTTILPTATDVPVHGGAQGDAGGRFARIHPRFLTPTWSTVGMGLISAVLFIVFTFISQNLLAALIGSLGLMIAFYYGLTGLACVWFYRRTLFRSARNFVFRGLFPFLGFVMLAVIFVYGLQQYALPDWLQDDAGKNVTILGDRRDRRGRPWSACSPASSSCSSGGPGTRTSSAARSSRAAPSSRAWRSRTRTASRTEGADPVPQERLGFGRSAPAEPGSSGHRTAGTVGATWWCVRAAARRRRSDGRSLVRRGARSTRGALHPVGVRCGGCTRAGAGSCS